MSQPLRTHIDWLPESYRDVVRADGRAHWLWLKERLAFAVRTRDADILHTCTTELSSLLNGKVGVAPEDRTFVAEALLAMLHANVGADTDLRCMDALTRLLRHKDAASAPGLVVAWEPLLDKLLATHFPKQRIFAALNRQPHGEALVECIRAVNRFFPPGATAQILARVRPMLCPHSGVVFVGQALLAAFLPTNTPEAHCWVDEVFAMWPWLDSVLEWNLFWLDLLSRLARDQAGIVDLQPYAKTIFTNVLRLLELPVGSGTPPPPHGEAIADIKVFLRSHKHREPVIMSKAAELLVYLLEPSGAAQRMLSNLFRYIEPFYHPSNGGKWSGRLARFLKSLCSQFAKRIGRERRDNGFPSSFKLTQQNIRDFSAMVVPIICKAQYSKSSAVSVAAAKAAMRIAYVDPEAVIPPLLDTVFPALETLTETHQTISALQMLGYIARPLVWRAHYPEGAAYISRLLFAALPGVDVNDMAKTGATLKFLIELLQWMPLVDATVVSPEPEALADKAAWQLTSMFGDWVSLLLDKLFGLFGMQASTEKGEGLETAIGMMTRGLTEVLFQSMSDEIYAAAVRKLAQFASSTILPNALCVFGHAIAAACAPNPTFALGVFMPLCRNTIVSELGGLNQLADNELLWFLRIAEQSVKRAGSAVLAHRSQILDIINSAFGSQNKLVVKTGCKLIKNTLRALTATYPLEYRAFSKTEFADPELYKRWGEAATIDKLDIVWHVPSEAELSLAAEIVDTFGLTAMHQLEALLASDISAITPPPPSASPTIPEAGNSTVNGSVVAPIPVPAQSPPPQIKLRAGAMPSESIETISTPSLPRTAPIATPQQPSQQQHSPTPIYSRGRPFGASLSPAPQDYFHPRSLSIAPAQAFSVGGVVIGRATLRGMSLSGVSNGTAAVAAGLHPVTPPPPAAIAHLWASKRLREQMLRLLYRLRCVVIGSAAALVDTDSAASAKLPLEEWKRKWVLRWRPQSYAKLKKLECKATRERIGEFLHSFAQSAIASHNEDDPSLLASLAKTIGPFLAQPRGITRTKLITELSYHSISKGDCRDACNPKRCFPRWMLISKIVYIHAESMLNISYSDAYSELLDNLLHDLLELSLNSFSEVRKKAQPAFASAVHRFPHALGLFAPRILRVFADRASKDWQVTGAAYLTHQPNLLRNIATQWRYFTAFVSSVCQSFHHEKPTVQTRLYNLFSSVSLMFDEIRLRRKPILSAAECPDFIARSGVPPPREEDLLAAEAAAKAETASNFALLDQTVDTLITVSESSAPPRYMLVIASCLFLLTTGVDCVPSERLIGFFLRGCHSDLPNYRLVCLRGLTFVMLRLKSGRKPCVSQIPLDSPPLTVAEYPDVHALPPIVTAEEWERTCFLDKNWIGWNGVPAPKKIYADFQLAKADDPAKSVAKLEEAFWAPGFVQTLVTGMVNSKRQRCNFSESAAQFWKGLAQIFRLRLVELLWPPLEALVANTAEHGAQEVASEMFSGVLRGSKHWKFDEQKQLWAVARPLLHRALEEYSLEAAEDWSACIRFITFDRDPRRLRWLIDELVESAGKVTMEETSSSLVHAKRLKFLQQLISELTWRATSLNDWAVGLLQTVVAHPYKQVRDRVAVLLRVLFRNSWVPARDPQTRVPISRSPPVLHTREAAFIDVALAADNFEQCSRMTPTNLADPAFQSHMCFVRTLVSFVSLSCRGGGVLAGKTVRFFLQILPFLFRLKDHPSQDICAEVRACLGVLSNITVPQSEVPTMAATICNVFESAQWHTRMAALPILEVLAYRHVFLIEGETLARLMDAVTSLLSDPQLEVRVQTSKTLAGILKLLDDRTVDSLRSRFLAQASAVPAARALVQRHGGVLGIASVILSFPYDVPAWMPDLLLRFAAFISDPMPIKATVKQTFMEFWRTHSDSWEAIFKRRFTSEQLSELTQLLVSPSYFA